MAVKTSLHLDHEPDMFWATNDEGGDKIGLRFDAGDAGAVFLDRAQTTELIDLLLTWQRKMGWL
jgi:hypothetical protein